MFYRFTIHGQKLAEEITCHNSNYPTSASENTNNGIYLTNLPNELLEHIILYLGKCGYVLSKIWHTQNSANELHYNTRILDKGCLDKLPKINVGRNTAK